MEKKKKRREESGFVLVAALLILLVLTVMGIAVNRSTMTEWRIAMNDRLHKETFYAADGGTELAQEILEQNIACLIFTSDPSLDDNQKSLPGNGFDVLVNDALELWRNFGTADLPSDGDYDICFPFNGTDCLGGPRTNITIAGNTKLMSGAAIQMAAGYEGRGKALASGGSRLLYDINTQRIGRDNSESMICVNYEHVLGNEGTCNFN